MTLEEVDHFADVLGPIVKDLIAASTAALTQRLTEAEAQIAVLKERGSGVRSAIRSAEGNLVLSMATGQLLDVGPVNGRDGRDADMALVERMIDERVLSAVSSVPVPVDGKDADPKDVAIELRGLVEPGVMSDVIGRAEKYLAEIKKAISDHADERIDAEIYKRFAAIPVPVDGKDGASVTVDDVRPILGDMVNAAFEAMPKPENGRDGRDGDPGRDGADGAPGERGTDGKDIDPELIETLVMERVERAMAALPKAQDGHTPTDDEIVPLVEKAVAAALGKRPVPKDGVDGLPGVDGKDGASVTLDDIIPVVEKSVDAAMASRPVPKDGVGMAGAVVDRDGRLILTLSDGSTRDLGTIVGKDADMEKLADIIVAEIAKMPKPKDGVDALGIEHIECEYDGERDIVIRFVNGSVVREFPLHLPIPIDRGVWRDGTYERGDGVSYGGSYWLAQKDTTSRPEVSSDWRLSAKRGRDGKNTETVKVLPATVKRDDDKT
jgi:hypothetical protein